MSVQHSSRSPAGEVHSVSETEAGERLDKWLASPDRLGSRSRADAALERGKVFVDEVEQGARDGTRRLAAGSRVRIWQDRPGSARRERPGRAEALGAMRILHEDDDLIIVDKPAGLLTVPREMGDDSDDTVVARLERWLDPSGRRRVFVVHRIDRDTTGLVVVARHGQAVRDLALQFRRREPGRHYVAVVHGIPAPAEGMWEDRLVDDPQIRVQRRARPQERGAEAIARYRITERFPAAALLAVDLVTGKRNQIRVQALLRGHPLIGDTVYAAPVAAPIAFPRPALHAARLVLRHPRTGKPVEFESPLPADLVALIARLRAEGGS